MRLRSDKFLLEMARSSNNNNNNNAYTSNTRSTPWRTQEQSTQASVNGANVQTIVGVTALIPVSTVVGITAPVIVSIMATSMHPDIVAFVQPPVSFPKTHMGTNPLLGSYVKTRFPFMPHFTLSMANKDFSLQYANNNDGRPTNQCIHICK
jgi:hypothetical protein